MVGSAYNPNNCAFLNSQALNANQFNLNVPYLSNSNNHNVLWDFIAQKLYLVNTLTNIIEAELPGLATTAFIADIEPVITEVGYQFTCIPSGGIADAIATVNTLVGGTGYTDGTYVVAATGGSGTGAAFTITVVGGVVTSAIVSSAGVGYTVGNVLTLAGGNGNATVTVATVNSYSYSWSLESGPASSIIFVGATNTATVTVDVDGGISIGLIKCVVTDLQGSKTDAYYLVNIVLL